MTKPGADLSDRERYVLGRLIAGRTGKQVGTESYVSEARIANILTDVRRRYDATTTVELVAKLVGSGAMCSCGAALSREDCENGPAVRTAAAYR